MGNLLNLIAGGTNALAMAAEEMDMDVILNDALMTSMWADWGALSELLIRFFLNTAVIALIVRVFYYPKSKRRDYFFTFMLIAISVFLLIFLMGGVKLKIGFALGLFAIFGIIRYRTESVPIREMTYLFLIIAVNKMSFSYLTHGRMIRSVIMLRKRIVRNSNTFLLCTRVRQRNCGQKRPGIRMKRMRKELIGLRHLHHLSKIHHPDPVGEIFDNG